MAAKDYCWLLGFLPQGRLNMTLMARVSAERAAQSKAAATSSGVKPNRWVMRGITSTFLLAMRFRQRGYCKATRFRQCRISAACRQGDIEHSRSDDRLPRQYILGRAS